MENQFKKYVRNTCFLFLGSFCLTACNATEVQKISQPKLGPNLVKNAGFENGSSNWSLNAAKVVSDVAHNGKYSLQYTNTNSQNYRLIQQGIPVRPGQIVHFSAWVKGENIATKSLYKSKGAGVFMQSYDGDGKYINGSFPFTLPGTFDWTQIQGMYVVPEKASRAVLGLFLRKETTGTVWFDDISLQVEEPRVFQTTLQYPNYRGITTADNQRPWKVIIQKLNEDGSNVTVTSKISDATGKVLSDEIIELPPGESTKTIEWHPTPPVAKGKYHWHISLKTTTQQKSLEETYTINVQQQMPRVYIDAEGFTRIDGERFFPFGIITGKSPERGSFTTEPEHLKRMADAGLNTVFSYVYGDRRDASQFLDNARQNNLKVIYNLKDIYNGWNGFPHNDQSADERVLDLVRNLQNSPALLAWYINDEYGYGEIPAIEKRYHEISAIDLHPVYQLQNKLPVLSWNARAADIIGTDPYPARYPDSDLGGVTKTAQEAVKIAADTKAVWQVSQIHDHSLHKGKGSPPSLDQIRNMAYQNLIAGSKGLLFYSYHWLFLVRNKNNQRVISDAAYEKRWADVKKMTSEIGKFLPVILKDDQRDIKSTFATSIVYRAWQDGDKLYLMVANPVPERASLNLTLPAGWKLGTNNIPGITTSQSGQNLQLDLAPIASGTLILDKP